MTLVMTAVTKKPRDACELKVHTGKEGDSLVHLTHGQKQRASKHVSGRSKTIDRNALARTQAFVREA